MRLVFVCSGNTCRSPLALCAWRLAVGEHLARGSSSGGNSSGGNSSGGNGSGGNGSGSNRGEVFGLGHIQATSAGLCASAGAPAAFHAQAIARSWGEDLSGHRASLFRPEHAAAELLVTMTGDQSAVLSAHFATTPGQVRLLGDYVPRGMQRAPSALWSAGWDEALTFGDADEADILDPLGGSLEAYEACAGQIRRGVFELARVLSGFS